MLRDRITEILRPAIDPRAPYAKVMIDTIIATVATSPDVDAAIAETARTADETRVLEVSSDFSSGLLLRQPGPHAEHVADARG